MKNKYIDLVEQTFDFPQDEFRVENGNLIVNEIDMMDIIKQYGTPLKITYLPKITSQIQRAKRMFRNAMSKVGYEGDYHYCYCTKSSQFEFVIEQALKSDVHLETSSAYDLDLIRRLEEMGLVDRKLVVICNGFKRPQYITNIGDMINDGWQDIYPILDNKNELEDLDDAVNDDRKVSLGIRYSDIIPFYKNGISKNPKFSLKMLHFFINTGIRDNSYYWNELSRCLNLYCDLKQVCPDLDSLNIGGGLPIKNSLAWDFDYKYMIEEIVYQVKSVCDAHGVPVPDIYTEFGNFTVGESGATIFKVLDVKQQNDRECWYMIDNSFMTCLPDTWGLHQRFILFPINKWNEEYHRVFIGGLTCDSKDFYNSEAHANAIFLPVIKNRRDPLYIGFFHTGAYQEAIAGYGGVKHCLQPSPKHILIDKERDGTITTRLFAPEQSAESMLKILGF